MATAIHPCSRLQDFSKPCLAGTSTQGTSHRVNAGDFPSGQRRGLPIGSTQETSHRVNAGDFPSGQRRRLPIGSTQCCKPLCSAVAPLESELAPSYRAPDLEQTLQTAVSAGQMDRSERGTYHFQSGQGGLVEQFAVGACTAGVHIQGALPCLQLIGARLTDNHQVYPADRVQAHQDSCVRDFLLLILKRKCPQWGLKPQGPVGRLEQPSSAVQRLG